VLSFALVTIFWTIAASVAALVIWLLLKGLEWLCGCLGWKSVPGFLLIFAEILALLSIFTLIGKTAFTKELISQTTKFIVLLCVFVISLFLAWRYRDDRNIVQGRITPLVWLFGIWFAASIPIVAYHAWIKDVDTYRPEIGAISSSADMERTNIILVSFDSLTSRDMSAYGYDRPTTPFIDRWSRGASTFSRFQSASNWTSSAAASMMTGKRVWTHRMFQGDSRLLNSKTESLPLELRKHGYYNMAFVANGYASVKRLGVENGFDIAPRNTEFGRSRTLVGIRFGTLDIVLSRLFGDRIKSYSWIIFPDFILGKFLRKHFLYSGRLSRTEAPPESAFNYFLKTVDKGVQSPFFAWIHLYPPHDPYLASEKFMGLFDPSMKLRSFNKQMEDEVEAHKVKNDEDWAVYRARYDEFIRYCDEQFEDFVKEVRKRDELKDAVIIFTSDHGESFEHDYFTHNTIHHYEQVTHIPLMIEEPGRAGTRIDELADQVDLAPTILDLADVPVPSWMEGSSLLPLMRGEALPTRHVYSMSFQKNPSRGGRITKGTVAVWDGDYKLIHYLDENRSLFFDLEKDPDELVNLFDEKEEIALPLLDLIYENLEKADEKVSAKK
jgi:arylsulfatase A-like enzyme